MVSPATRSAVAHDPRHLGAELQQFGHRALGAGGGQVADPIAQANQPGDDAAGHHIALPDRRRNSQRIEEVDIQAPFAAPNLVGALEDRVGVVQHQRHVDCQRPRIARKRQHQRQSRQRQRPALLFRDVRAACRADRSRRPGRVEKAQQLVEVVDAKASQHIQQLVKLIGLLGAVFDNQVGAIVIDAHGDDEFPLAQPGQRRFRQRRRRA